MQRRYLDDEEKELMESIEGIGGLAVAHIGYSALSFALVASTIGSSLLLTFFIRTKAEDRAREYFQ